MSFGSGGFGGFGQNNQQPASTFGGFGAANNPPSSGFGAPASNNAFGANTATTGTGLFGSNNAPGTSGFGSGTTGGGFGGGNSSFGAAKPAFGAPATTAASGSLFGSTTTPAATGGFGFGTTANNNNNSNTAATGSFGGSSGLFGGTGTAKAATPAFGATTNNNNNAFGAPSASLFGNTGAGLGANTNTTPAFGATGNPGLGTNVGDPPGTLVVPFAPFTEKESNSASSTTNSFQSILFMDAYKKWSSEELRLADYGQGRRHGNVSGTGTFGTSTFGTGATGGFGTTNTSGFGGNTGVFGNTQPNTGFGAAASNTAGAGFGGTTNTPAGSLFGAAKPSTMFGAATNTQPAAGSLFGGGASAGTGFGAANTANNAFGAATNAGAGGMFGNTAAKPSAFGGFGNANTAATGAFGSNPAQPGGFGAANPASTGPNLFGNANQGTNAANTGSNLFGNANAQQQQQPATSFGGTTAFGQTAQPSTGLNLFGQQKPGGIFGSTPATNTATTGTGIFGNAGAQNAFGAPANQNTASGSLFGKPAGTGTGIFGTPAAAQPGTTGSLFGSLGTNTQAQQPAATSLFGSLGQNNQAKPLFSQPAATGASVFGQSTGQPQQGGVFGSTLQQAQQPLGSSMFGGLNNQAAPQPLATSINDPSAFGSTALFSTLIDDRASAPGPLATPLSGAAKAKSRSILPVYRLSPATSNKFATPQKRAGFGFSYSTYGTPSSPSSIASTPGGLGQSLLLANNSRGLSKSISASSLRRSYNIEDSILAPGAFSASTGPKLLPAAASHKKLVINKDIRSDLFSSPAKDSPAQEQPNGGLGRKLAKRVSFDTELAEANASGNANKAIEAAAAAAAAAPQKTPETGSKSTTGSPGRLQPSPSRQSNGNNGGGPALAATTEMQQVKGNELAIVHEEASPASLRRTSMRGGDDVEPGPYWMNPTEITIENMSIRDRQKVQAFTVGRENVGSVQFKVPVDLTAFKLDELYDSIIVLTPRSCTVYPISAKKPPVGKGLNVPAIISLEHSFPRGGPSLGGRKLDRHLERLKSIPDTKFEHFDRERGVWTFSVDHFTTYGLDESDEDEEDDADESLPNPSVEAVSKWPQPVDATRSYASSSPLDQTGSPDVVGVHDTSNSMSSRRIVPGAFDNSSYGDEMSNPNHAASKPSFLLSGALAPVVAPAEDESMADEDDIYEQAELMALPSPRGSEGGDQDHHDYQLAFTRSGAEDSQVPGGIMRARMRAFKKSTAPTKIEVAGGNDWTQILQESVRAPRAVDRDTLRAQNESGALWEMEDQGTPVPLNHHNKRVVSDGGFATSIDLMKSLFEQSNVPAQSARASPAQGGFVKWPYQKRDKDEAEEDGVPVSRPSWGPNGRLVTTINDQVTIATVDIDILDNGITSLAQLATYMDNTSAAAISRDLTGPSLREMAQGDAAWELAALLFENNSVDLAPYWRQIVSDATDNAIKQAPSPEEKALDALSGHRVADACAFLLAGKDFRLATLVACIGVNTKDMRAQVQDWRDSNALSDFSDSIRALYELLAGNACTCAGVKNVPIENRASSFVISQRFGLDWMRSFGLRLFYATPGGLKGASSLTAVGDAVRSFEADIQQDREPEPDSPIWTLLKIFATRRFDWADYSKLGWLLTRSIYATGKIEFAESLSAEREKLDAASIAFASALTAQANGNWVAATFVLLHISDPVRREAAVRDHLGRHAHLISPPRSSTSRNNLGLQSKPSSSQSQPQQLQQQQQQQQQFPREGTFSALRRLGVPAGWIWEAKALDFRARQDARQEFLALVWAGCYAEASRTFVERLAPDLVIARDLDRLFGFAELLYRVRARIPDWDRGAAVYMLYPMALQQQQRSNSISSGVGVGANSGAGSSQQNKLSKDTLDGQLLDGLTSLHAAMRDDGHVRRRAALSDMAEELIKCRGGDTRLYQMLPGDVRERYLRRRALEGIC